MKAVDLRPGLATSIGSLPHTDPRAAATFVLERQPTPPGRALAAQPLGRRADDRPGRLGHRRRRRCSTTARSQVDDPALDPRAPLTDPGIDGAPFVAPARLPRRGGRPAGADQAAAHRPGHARHRARTRVGVPGPARLRRRRRRRAGPGPHARRRRPGDRADGAARRVRRRARPHRRDAPRLPARPRTARSTSCRARWPRSSPTPSPACTAAARPTGASCCRPARRSSRSRSTPARSTTPARSAPSSSAAAGSPGARCPPPVPLGSTPERLWQQLSAEWCALTQAGCDPVLLREQAHDHPGLRPGRPRRGAGRPRARR